ncbi:hypothetical protein NIES4073_58640 [Kalymmatonema gypsitolerans NIES-4073]|nr:hypothetical protein NIES4073_58640 [Scytonema sp. NIES-4073]
MYVDNPQYLFLKLENKIIDLKVLLRLLQVEEVEGY